jgi:hypothetical protein
MLELRRRVTGTGQDGPLETHGHAVDGVGESARAAGGTDTPLNRGRESIVLRGQGDTPQTQQRLHMPQRYHLAR